MLPAIAWKKNKVVMIDQRKLPLKEIYLEYDRYGQVARAIETMVIRGAPAIGVAAAYGVALGVLSLRSGENIDRAFEKITKRLERTRPTARNLFWALERMRRTFDANRDLTLARLKRRMLDEAMAIETEDVATNEAIGRHGRDLIPDGATVLTHCNAGELATAGYGTAVGVIRAAHEQGKKILVFSDETRPFLQGARLTCWELDRRGIPVVLITDNMAGWFMQKGEIQVVVVGADRIVRNGDTANKIGTYSVAVLAKEHDIPFYVAAPMSTVDAGLATGDEIPIEERDPHEVRKAGGRCVTLPHIAVRNPAFDVTPAKYIAGIITENGIFRPPYSFRP
ncbi:S-methyl-5-thioribose-1-phosphate isomerase [bacterium]|nr:MAG: S-methyl-5-thioribose-1-phosphate isomerase [bacterium]